MSAVVVIPAFNEAAKIGSVVEEVRARGYPVVVVDDGSRDGTAAAAGAAGATVLRHVINRGYGAALTTGSRWAVESGAAVIVHFDADGQHDPDDIEPIVAPIREGTADVTIGSRFLDPETRIPAVRKVLIKAAVVFTRLVSRVRLTDAHNGFRAFSNAAMAGLDCREDGMSYASEVVERVARRGLRLREVPVSIQYSDYSLAKGEGNLAKVRVGLRFLWSKLSS